MSQNGSQTTPTKEEIEREQTGMRSRFIECCKQVLQAFDTDDYRVSVRGAVTFQARITVIDPAVAVADDYDERQSDKLTRYLSNNFPEYAGKGAGDVAIELIQRAYGRMAP